MRVRTLLPDGRALKLMGVEFDHESSSVTICVRSALLSSNCPVCGRCSRRVHSRYDRRLKDLPWQGFSVHIVWQARRFFCDVASCPRRIFVERCQQIAAPHSRRTERLTQVLRSVVVTCGGEAGSRLADRLGIRVSADTLLRVVRRVSIASPPTPKAIGVDDWAYRKGKRYGTLICDLENGKRLDLLPDRDADSLAAWLRQRPGIEIISRDRSDIYRKGATLGAPNAIQVADRFHLMKNLRDAFAKFLDGQQGSIRLAIEDSCFIDMDAPVDDDSAPAKFITKEEQRKTASRTRRQDIYVRVMELHEKGVSARSIAKQVGIHRSTVRKFVRSDGFPERGTRLYHSNAKAFEDYLRERWNAGCRNASLLWQEVKRKGFDGSYHCIRRFVAHWRDPDSDHASASARHKPNLSASQASWLFFKHESKLTKVEREAKIALLTKCDAIRQAWYVARRFIVMLRQRKGQHFDRWLDRSMGETTPKPLRQFAEGLKKDVDAVMASLTLRWSNGSSEGHIGRLKMIKRQMYGRANFDLLRARFLGVA